MNTKNQRPNLRSKKDQSANYLIWIISGLYLLVMVWFLLSRTGTYGTHESQPWLASAVTGFTVAYGILMMWLWPNEEASTTKQMGSPQNSKR
jgi:succinate dehydrogenase hydrophobic anchor subunit